jgi:hypothetical protein
MSWAFTTIRHGLLPPALTRGPRGADRGRRSANPRSPGGLVTTRRADTPPSPRVGGEDAPTGSKRAATACFGLMIRGRSLRPAEARTGYEHILIRHMRGDAFMLAETEIASSLVARE